jgi:hypothetical protein
MSKVSSVVLLRSYKKSTQSELQFDECKIWEACLATSAMTTLFDPITIDRGDEFADGAVRYNNPVQLVYREAGSVWPYRVPDAVLISIGSGSAPLPSFQDNVNTAVYALQAIVTDSEREAQDFSHSHPYMVDSDLLFRFNVGQGLASIGLQEYKLQKAVAVATASYFMEPETRAKYEKCLTQLSNQGLKPAPATSTTATADSLEKYGLFLLNPSESSIPSQQEAYAVDIISVHGIMGNAFQTWTDKNGKMWLRDFLPNQLPGARVYSFGYAWEIAFTLTTGALKDVARSLLERIKHTRVSQEVSPWLCCG